MGILDRFRKAPAPSTTPRGRSGRAHFDGFLDLEELNADLRGAAGYEIYDRMYRTDPDVGRAADMTYNPIIKGTFDVEPYGGDEATDTDREIAETVKWVLFEFMRPGFKAHLAEALPCFGRWGNSPFEQLWGLTPYKSKELLAPRKLGLRLPRTINRYTQDDDGELTAIEQFLPTGGMVMINARDLVFYRVGAEGDNWEGISLLRRAYKPWFLKDKLERLDAIGQEREAVGIPVLYPPAGHTDETVLDAMEEKLAQLRGGELGYLIMPGPHAEDVKEGGGGWRFEIVGFGSSSSGKGSGRDAQPSLKYHSDKIAAAFIAEFMRLGQSGEGARATADVQQDPFHASVQALADVVLDEINDSVIARFVALNWADVEGPPKLVMSEADQTSLTDLKDYAAGLAEKGLLHPDNDLEDWLRKRGKLPPADPEARKQRQEMDAANADLELQGKQKELEDPAPEPEPSKKTARRQDRELRWWEQTMSLETIETSIDECRARFEASGGDLARAYARDVAAAAAEGKDPATEIPVELVDALTELLTDLYALGRHTVADELDRQRQGYAHPERYAKDDALDRMRARARVAAQGVVSRILQAVTGLAVGGRKSQAELQAAGEREAAAALRAQAQLHAAAALNEGRYDEADEQSEDIAGSRYTSILDTRRCGACELADDDVLRPLDDPVRLSRVPPNLSCEGGDRCRCMEFFQLREEAAPAR